MNAVIDIGSNSVRLLLSLPQKVNPKQINSTQLSKNMAILGKLDDDAIIRTADAVADFFARAKAAGADNVFIFGTEAMRNIGGDKLKNMIESNLGVSVDIISGTQEAEIGFIGATGGKGKKAVIDIGGASVEVVEGEDGKISYAESLKLGVVRTRDIVGDNRDDIYAYYANEIKKYKKITALSLIGIGGTVTSLASMLLGQKKYDAKAIHGYIIEYKKLLDLIDKIFLSKSLTSDFPTLSEKRAGVIAHGAILLALLMQYMGFERLEVSEHDNMEGYLAYKNLQ